MYRNEALVTAANAMGSPTSTAAVFMVPKAREYLALRGLPVRDPDAAPVGSGIAAVVGPLECEVRPVSICRRPFTRP